MSIGNKDLGYVDLRFESPADEFTLFAELKLHSGYGDRQLERYLDALDELPEGNSGLVAVTSHYPRYGEEAVGDNPKWLGSIRWSAVYDQMLDLEHCDQTANVIWPALLALIRQQGDFGLMDFDPEAVKGWSRWREGRGIVDELLEAIHGQALDIVLEELAGAQGVSVTDDLAGYIVEKRLVTRWAGSINLRLAVPVGNGERLRIQIAGDREVPVFTAEARHEDARPLFEQRDPGLLAATKRLRDEGFDEPGWDYGTYWSRPHPPDEWLYQGTGIQEALLHLVQSDVRALARSGIFEALPPEKPGTAVTRPPEEDEAL